MSIKSEIKKIEGSQIEVVVTVDWEDWKIFIDEAVTDLSKEIKTPGFRKGKAPRNIVQQKVGSGLILEEAANKAIQKTYKEIVASEKIDAIGAPKAQLLKIAEGNELQYKVVTAVVPIAKIKPWKNEVKKINKEYANKKIEISDEDVEKELLQIAGSRVQLVEVDREAKDGDSVLIDFKVTQDGVPIEHGTSKKHPLILGRGVFIPGFEENLIGMKTGEEKSFELNFPKEYHDKNLAGKLAKFEVKIGVVQERITPEVSDAFAKSLGKFEDLASLRKNIREGLLEEKTKEQAESRKAALIEVLIKATEVSLPEVLVHEELHKMLGEFEMQLGGMGGMTLDVYLEQIKKTKEDIEKEWQPQAEKRVIAALALEEVAKEEEIESSAEEIELEMNRVMAQYKNVKDVEKNVDLSRLYTYIKGTKQNEKVFEMMEKLQ
jgi:trigger factor